jgi:hypothetical protein
MKSKFMLGIALALCVVSASVFAQENRGHHQSGITGRVGGGFITAGENGRVHPDFVRVYSPEGDLLVEVETEVVGNVLWHFEIFLKPGNYTVLAYAGVPPEEGGTFYSFAVPVTVEKKEFTELVLSFRPQ